MGVGRWRRWVRKREGKEWKRKGGEVSDEMRRKGMEAERWGSE